jgi:hypothetical protein
MVEDEVLHGFNRLYRRAIHAFPANFRGQKTANTMKATRWWQQREEFNNNIADRSIIFLANQSRLGKKKRILTKARPGRGSKHSEWVYGYTLISLQYLNTLKGLQSSFRLYLFS